MILEAMNFSIKAHAGARRRYTGQPYIVHPFAVAGMVSDAGFSRQAVAAAFLHDVVEDTEFSVADIEAMFGSDVAKIVNALSSIQDEARPLSRSQRKAAERDRLAVSCAETQTIKVADIIDNSVSIIANDKSFAKIYIPERKRLVNVLGRADMGLLSVANNIVDSYLRKEGLDV